MNVMLLLTVIAVLVADFVAFEAAGSFLRGVTNVGPVEAIALVALAFACVAVNVRLAEKVLDLLRRDDGGASRINRSDPDQTVRHRR